MFLRAIVAAAGSLLAVSVFIARPVTQTALVSPTFTAGQAAAGRALYDQQCASCHGSSLDNGEFGPPLSAARSSCKAGAIARSDEVFDLVINTMPLAAPGSLTPEQAMNLLAYVLQRNAVAISDQAAAVQRGSGSSRMVMPTPTNGFVGGLANGVALPPPPNPVANPLDRITPVTEAMLRNPPDGDWLTWRRTPQVDGFSPLTRSTRATSIACGSRGRGRSRTGRTKSTPLVHDGVMFVYGHGDIVQALDAASGDLLWQYTRSLPNGVAAAASRSRIAILGTNLLVATSDMHIDRPRRARPATSSGTRRWCPPEFAGIGCSAGRSSRRAR